MTKKNLAKTIIFLVIFALLFGYVTQVFTAKWTTGNRETYMSREFYNTEKNSVEVCIIGSSQVVYGMSAMEMYKNAGISAISLGTSNQSLLSSYYWLKECMKRQDISTVVLDTSMLFEDANESFSRKSLDSMKFSGNKLQAIYHQSQLAGADSFPLYLVQLIKYHSRWNELTEEDFNVDMSDTKVYRGNIMATTLKTIDYDSFIIDNDEIDDSWEMVDYQLEYFNKIVEYCEENGLNLLLVKTPKDNWNLTKHEQVAELAEQLNLPFLDFNSDEMLTEIGFNSQEDMKDIDHFNTRGAIKFSDYLSDYLMENYELTDYRETAPFDAERVADFDREKENDYMATAYDAADYLTYLGNARYDVLIEVSDQVTEQWTDEMQQQLEAFGVTTDLRTLNGLNYICHIRAGETIYETAGAEALQYDNALIDGTAVSAVNDRAAEEKAVITIEGDQTVFSSNGINVLVYDNEKGKVIDRATIYENDSFGSLRVRR